MDDKIGLFAAELRALRGHRSYQEMAAACDRSVAQLAAALSGEELPPLRVVEAYVAACGADPAPWRARWLKLSGAPRPWWDPRRRPRRFAGTAALAGIAVAVLLFGFLGPQAESGRTAADAKRP